MPHDTSDPLEMIAPELAPALALFPDLDFSQGIEAIRGGLERSERPPLPAGLEAVRCTERFVPGPPGAPDVRVLHYAPPGAGGDAPRPALLHIHGGGYVLGAPELNDAGNRARALAMDCVVVSVAYRLAPETRFPGARDDCYAVLQWLHAEADDLGIDRARIAAAGESAGGGHAVALALHARDRARRDGGPAPSFLLLDAPMIDDRTCARADPHPHAGRFVWTAEKNRFGWQALLGMEPGSPDVPADAVPGRATDLGGLPPMFISVGALDLFVEENLEFARRLTRAAVPVELHVVPGAYHGFGLAGATPQTQLVEELRSRALARAFSR